MDVTKVKKLRRTLTLHFVVISWLTAMLVATGSGTYFLPAFIFFVSVAAFIFVDTLEWFELKSISSAVGMCVATGAAIASYIVSAMNDSESGQLLSVAGLLVYPEAVLFLQRKNLRVFEQLAVFLLLEMIVAALVNDNVLFGVLLTPIMLLWVSSLFLFSRYATLVSIDPTIEKPLPKLAELLFKKFVRSVLGENKNAKLVTSKFVASNEVQRSLTFRRLLQSFPIGFGAIAFAALFFYLLPRTTPANFNTSFGNQASIGLPDTLTFGNVGKILQNPTAVMRVTIRDQKTGRPFRPKVPPYLRSKVFDSYGPTPERPNISKGAWGFSGQLYHRVLGARDRAMPIGLAGRGNFADDARELERFGRELVYVEFDMKTEFASSMFTVPPVFASPRRQKLELLYDEVYMILQPLDETSRATNKAVIYEHGSSGFAKGQQLSVTPARNSPKKSTEQEAFENNQQRLIRGFSDFRVADGYRKRFLQSQQIDPSAAARIATEIERHLAFSGEFGYSLDLSPPSDPDLDPLEDFLVNQKVGHCQYFASAMVCLLRQSGIPSRIVIGYRPTEFNQLGNYFLVRQNDAHAWVEALFSREQLENTVFEESLTDHDSYWVRFDPTPPPDGEQVAIIDQQGQAIDFAEKLWKDYVLDGQNLANQNSLYAQSTESSENPYEALLKKVTDFKDRLLAGEIWNGKIGFAWPIAILVVVLGTLALAIWQLVVFFPSIAPRLAKRLGVERDESRIKELFYYRCIKLLSRLGMRRAPSETPKEFVSNASQVLDSRGHATASSTQFLTDLYYRLRFGLAQAITADEKKAIEAELSKLEKAVAESRQ